jgi:DNA-directed RNA polymerase specialized sigma24 family protein
MDEPQRHDVTVLLDAIAAGDRQASENLLPLVYEELRRLAATYMSRERSGQTLQATALVHEAYVRLIGVEDSGWDH